MEWQKDEFTVTCDPDKADLEVISGFLGQSYWVQGISPSLVRKWIDDSIRDIALAEQLA
ncbi:MAG: hypothetical protein Q7J56_03890 [Deltaproteobacteria bacterium]|nr:hypothetical protein [Deltaproteobacteria bacterium]